jgi:hypothetical protein
LLKKPKGLNPLYKKVVQYAKDRDISKEDIIKYNIGYCDGGIYNNRIIIPSYNSDGRLNYFIARSVFTEEKFKYKNPPVSKNVTIFENQINWKKPITLTEGVFDALAVKRNAIPLLGKFIPKTLMDSIYKKGVKEIKIILDKDAQDQALYYVNYFMNNGITVTNILPTEKDAGDMGFSEVNKMLKQTKKSGFEDIISQKLMGI